MKKIFLCICCLAALLATSCTDDDPAIPENPNTEKPEPEPEPEPSEVNVVLNELCGNKAYNGNKFIELYNAGEDATTMTGWTMRKYASDATDVAGEYDICWTAPQGLILAADGYLVLEADQTDPKKGFNAGLSAKKELKFELVNAEGEVVDSFIRGEDKTPFEEKSLPENKEASFSRVPNGEGEFAYAVPTPGTANGEATGEIEHVAPEPEPDPDPTPNPSVADGLSYIFDIEALPEIHLEIPLEQWNTLLKEYDKDINTDAYIHCDARFIKDGEEHSFADAGLRLRGNTSRRRPEAGNNGEMHKGDNADWQHVHFMLNLRKFQKDDAHELGGVRKIHLKWCKDDPAYVREIYCYNLFRRYGIETGIRCSYGRLWLKVEGDSKETYYGVYEMLEAIDEEYLENRTTLFGEGEYNLWKCGYGADLKETGGNERFMNDDDAGTGNYPYVLKTNCDNFASAKEQLIDFILKLNGKTGDSFKTWINQVTDVELLLKTYAVNVAVGMWDDYWCNMNNYYIYFNSNDKYDYKFFFIPYDYDNTLGTSNIIDAGRQDPTNWGDNSRKLISKLLEYPEYRKIYLDALHELCNDDNLFGATGSMQRISVWQNLIRQYVPNDTGEDMVIEDRPASWSNHSEYRIMTAGSNNFFTVKKNSIPKQ